MEWKLFCYFSAIRNRNGRITSLWACLRSCAVRQYHHYSIPTRCDPIFKDFWERGRFPTSLSNPFRCLITLATRGAGSLSLTGVFLSFYVLVFFPIPISSFQYLFYPLPSLPFFSTNFLVDFSFFANKSEIENCQNLKIKSKTGKILI